MKQLRGFNGDDAAALTQQAMDKYKNMNEDALVDALLDNVRRSKADGTFDPASLRQFATMMAPHLSAEKRERLENLIRLISSDV